MLGCESEGKIYMEFARQPESKQSHIMKIIRIKLAGVKAWGVNE